MLLIGSPRCVRARPIPIGIVVLQTDFGLKDQAVAAMRGVIRKVDQASSRSTISHTKSRPTTSGKPRIG